MTPQQPPAGRSHGTLRLTTATVAGVAVCLAAAGVELGRALGGNPLSWVYTFEWPLIAGYVVYIWHKLRSEARQGAQATAAAPTPDGSATVPAIEADPQLAAWQDYISRLHAADPPGGPPPARQPRSSGQP
ncbi:hypothetical protein N864_01000 [Intrasporangium chromatireducens Q5-1]|uniref:Uncharacterized protein n=1 Tax=Intrasporangium chromatireducens Q5-1 TaxID=584657 RepID=W9GNI6_9MICO|nr:hypothetical protein [Intrasporangium chromatireducens]EWT07675.1 hypothetical protein N864_01000 [Intrasporangium chromatireducens Q5-1]